jgi:hypothetical protein
MAYSVFSCSLCLKLILRRKAFRMKLIQIRPIYTQALQLEKQNKQNNLCVDNGPWDFVLGNSEFNS